MTKELTREMLEEYGIKEVNYDKENNEWCIIRYWHRSSTGKEKYLKRVKIRNVVGKRTYARDKVYPAVVFSYHSKAVSIPLGKLIYAWFKQRVPAGMDVDHKNNDPFNNQLGNLQLLTRKENLAKRFTDNPENCHNQWEWKSKHQGE